MRVPMIAGNWKMNTTVSEAIELVNEMRRGLDEIDGVDKVICPPFISLAAVYGLIKGSSVRLGAQNLYFEEKGAYTGEVSPLMLADLCQFVIIGHSERRQYFNERSSDTRSGLGSASSSSSGSEEAAASGSNEYPAPRTVTMTFGLEGSSSSFDRSR